MFYQKFVLFSFPTFRNSISSPSGDTALMYSAAQGHLEVCKLLVSSKADLAARDRCGRCQRCSRFSLNQSHPLACSDGKTALKCAIDEKKSDVVAFLRGIGAPQWLHAAVACNSRHNKTYDYQQTRWLEHDLVAGTAILELTRMHAQSQIVTKTTNFEISQNAVQIPSQNLNPPSPPKTISHTDAWCYTF